MITFPSSPRASSATPRFIDMGGIQKAGFGGEDQRLNRLGSRWAVDYQLPPMKGAEARVWIARLIRARHERGLMYFPQPGAGEHTPGAVAAISTIVASGSNSLPLKTMPSPQKISEGVFVSVIVANRRYIHQVNSGFTAAAGTAVMTPEARAQFPVDAVVELGTPMIEGYPEGDESGWNIDDAKVYGLAFSIVEAK